MFKYSSKIKYLVLLIVFAIALTVVPTNFIVAANSEENKTLNNEVVVTQNVSRVTEGEPLTPPANLGAPVMNDQTGIDDIYLYQYLLLAYNEHYNLTDKNHLTETTADDPATQLYVEMFKDFEELVLTNTSYTITSLKGLKVLNLENLKVLNVGQNQIEKIAVEDLKDLTSLEELILYDNSLTEITIPAGLTNLRVINLNKNKLEKFDASLLNVGELYLSFNKLTDINNVILPRIIYNTDLYVELFNNNITNADAIYTAGTQAESKIKIELGLQGCGLNNKANEQDVVVPKIAKNDKIKFYNSAKYPNLKVNIYNALTGVLVKSFTNSAETKIAECNLEVGEYRVEYVDATSGDSLYNWENQFACAFKTLNQFNVVPTAPIVKFVIKNKEYDTYGKFSGVAKMIATTPDDNGEMFYSINGGEWIKGTEVKLDRGGQYNVAFKYVITDATNNTVYESEIVSRYVTQSINPYIPDFVVVILLIALMLVLFFVVLPFVIKYGVNR